MKKQFLLIISVVLFGASAAFAQDAPAPLKQINKGVINGSALKLVKPAYPPAAKAVNAEGAVNVQVTIDENGSVVTAAAISGHPLLRSAAAQAARQSTFAPTIFGGQPVKVTGIIVYNFVGEDRAANWLKIGYDLGSAQYSSTAFLNANQIGKSFGTDWTAEKGQLQKLAQINRNESADYPEPMIMTEKQAATNTETKPDGTTIETWRVKRLPVNATTASSEQIAVAQSLMSTLQGRLAGSGVDLWQFNTGSTLSQLLAKSKNQSDRQSALATLRQQIQSAPGNVSPESLAELQKLAVILEKTNPTPEDNGQIGQILSGLFAN